MGLPHLETCCWVIDLKTGNIIMGCINAVYSFILTITMIVVAAMMEVPTNTTPVTERELNLQAAATGLYVMSIILVLMFLAKFSFDLFFVYGVMTENAGIIRAYLYMWTVFILLSMFTFFLNAPHYNIGTITMEVFYISFNLYAILLSQSFYKLLNTREEV